VAGGSYVFLRNPGTSAAPRPRASETPSASPDSAADGEAPTDAQRAQLLESVGSVSSIYLFQTHQNIGLLADAIKNETYTKEEAVELMSTALPLLQTVDAQMQKLENVGLDEDEVAAVKQVRKVSALLKDQVGHLQAHLQSGGKSSLEPFHRVRRESWNELRIVLGLAEQNAVNAE
jgi:divalent metal cation (Fe/Co/Zn/Cd) transporter